jgi:serine/threonine-protein kinase
MPLSPGVKLGPYEVLAPIGAGGMGHVYRAHDARTGRDVAIKVSAERFSDRFSREVHAVASMNHPNICQLYDVGTNYLVMELVEGSTLAERIRQGPVPLQEALKIARQIADALESAHEKGIIHRDLKPGNVILRLDGTVKVLDFGLAKMTHAGETSGRAEMQTVVADAETREGVIVGTPAYMPPEQVLGKPVDKRADIWAFGVVLYEMITGREPFASGATCAATLEAVLSREPDWDLLPRGTHPDIQRLLKRCLRKDLRTRLQAIGEARIAIDELAEDPKNNHIPSGGRRLTWIPWTIAAAACLAAIGGWRHAAHPPAPLPLVRMNVQISEELPLVSVWKGGLIALSPDGTRLAVTLRGKDGNVGLYTRRLSESQLTLLAGTEPDAGAPFFSPDGREIGFFSGRHLKIIPADGGIPVTLCDVPEYARGGTWGKDGTIVFAPTTHSGLWRVSAAGGIPAQLTQLRPAERTHRWPQMLPDGQSVLFTMAVDNSTYDEAEIDVFSIKTSQRKTVLRGGFGSRYLSAADGSAWLLYMHENTLFAAPFDIRRLALTGAAIPVLDGVHQTANDGGEFALSATES